MGFKEINYFYSDTVTDNECLYRSIDEKELRGSLFYHWININEKSIPIVIDNEEAKQYDIPVNIPKTNVSIVANIFAQSGGRIIHYKNLNLHIYENDGEYVIIQGTDTHIFIVGTGKENKDMNITAIDNEYNIHNMEFYYFGNPLDFDIELVRYEINGEEYIKTELDKTSRRVTKIWKVKDNRKLSYEIDYPLFFDTVTISIIIVEDSRLVLVDPDSVEKNKNDSYWTLYQYTKRDGKKILHSKFIRKRNCQDIKQFLAKCGSTEEEENE